MPRCTSNAYKRLVLYFPTLNLTITNEQINGDTFSLEESLCSDNLTFGACEMSCVRVTVADVSQELSGQLVVISQKVNDTYDLPLGTFIVDSAKKQTNLRFKDLICFDLMKKFDTDVTAWYNALTFPMTLKAFRESLCNYVGVEFTDSNLPNDNMQITKTIDPNKLIGRDVLICTEEINGAFGHMGRDGKLKHIVLNPSYGLYPSPNLYPSQDLYPVAPNDTGYAYGITDEEIHDDQMQSENDYEEYTCKEITKLQIRAEEGDIGAIVGTGENCYVIEGNFLVFGKTAVELSNIAKNAFYYINKRPYKSFQLKLIGLPFVEIGDSLGFPNDKFISFLMKRTLTGVQALSDTFSAEGDEEIQQVSTVNKEIIQLQGKTNVLIRDVDKLSSTITNVESQLQSEILQMADTISLKITSEQAQAIAELAVRDGLSSFTVTADKISLNGYTTINGNFQIDAFGNLKFIGSGAEAKFTSGYFKISDSNGESAMNSTMLTLSNAAKNAGMSYSLGSGLLVFNASGTASVTPTKINAPMLAEGGTPLASIYSKPGHSHISTDVYAVRDTTTSTGDYDAIRFINGDGAYRAATTSFVVSKIGSSSDERIKDDIQPLQLMLDSFMHIEPISFRYKRGTNGKIGTCFGVKAQQVKELFPLYKYDVVAKNNSDLNDIERNLCPDGMYEVNYNNLHMLTMRVVQEQQRMIEDLQKRVTDLEKAVGGVK